MTKRMMTDRDPCCDYCGGNASWLRGVVELSEDRDVLACSKECARALIDQFEHEQQSGWAA